MTDNVNKGITTYIVDGKEVDEKEYLKAQKSGARKQKTEVGGQMTEGRRQKIVEKNERRTSNVQQRILNEKKLKADG